MIKARDNVARKDEQIMLRKKIKHKPSKPNAKHTKPRKLEELETCITSKMT